MNWLDIVIAALFGIIGLWKGAIKFLGNFSGALHRCALTVATNLNVAKFDWRNKGMACDKQLAYTEVTLHHKYK